MGYNWKVRQAMPLIKERVGYGTFLFRDISDLISNGSFLRLLANYGLIVAVGKEPGDKRRNAGGTIKRWQITEKGHVFAEHGDVWRWRREENAVHE